MPATPEMTLEVRDAVDSLRAEFPEHAYLLFAAGLLLSTGDYEQLARDAVLDGVDDKKIDLFFIDREVGRAVVIQAHERPDWEDKTPPVNKATDLNAASAWLLDSDLDQIARPDIRSHAEELRDALSSGEVYEVSLYYLHNASPSPNVRTELGTVQNSLNIRLAQWAPDAESPIRGTATELSLQGVVGLYEARHAAITVTDSISLPTVSQAQQIQGDQWRGAQATVRARDLVRLVAQYGESLTSANIRDYLGRRSSSRNINQQIRKTAEDNPQNFWVYNNGLTLINRSFSVTSESLQCSGLAVTNGAQTLGSLAEVVDQKQLETAMIPIRVIASDNPSLIENIIRYNNTQNPIKPWELRVLDPVQARIEEDFKTKLGITYQYRRSRSRILVQNVHLSKLAPWLDAYNGQPTRAHRNSPELFENERLYRDLFNDEADVRHLLAVYRLGEAVGATKDYYKQKVKEETASEAEAELYDYFRYGAFTTVAIFLASEVVSEIVGGGRAVKGRLKLTARYEKDRELTIEYLRKVVEVALAPIPSELEEGDAYGKLRTEAGVATLRDRVQVSVRQLKALQADAVEALVEGFVAV